jgi:hypothetical protein
MSRWIRHAAELEASRPILGVGVTVTDLENLRLHAGVVFRGSATPPTLLHLRFHALLDETRLPDPHQHYVWSEVPLDEDRVEGAVAVCRRLFRRSGGRSPQHPIDYAVYYDGVAITEDGALPLGGRAIGVTCATFVLSVLKRFLGVDLVALDSWPRGRPEDAIWHRWIVSVLRDYQKRGPSRVTDAHIARVEGEVGCARYPPEEVAGAAPLFADAPVRHELVVGPARELVSAFVGAAAVLGLCEKLSTVIGQIGRRQAGIVTT